MANKPLQLFSRKFLLWIIFSVLITAFSGLTHLAVQQNLRQNANDPQIQMAEDTAEMLNTHKFISISSQVDVARSLAPFRIIYDSKGNVTSSEALLDRQTPDLPSGVFDSVRQGGEKRFTWQPEPGVRIAAVVVPYNDGFVLAGRSLREVEKREDQVAREAAGVWLGTMGVMTVLLLLL